MRALQLLGQVVGLDFLPLLNVKGASLNPVDKFPTSTYKYELVYLS
jgi:hypothetical protein